MIMSDFDGIEQVPAEGATSHHYFEPGNYLVEIERVLLHKKRIGGGKIFIVETTIKNSDNPSINPGEKRNWVQSLNNEYALPRIKAFIGTAIGLCPNKKASELNSTVTRELCHRVISEENPLAKKLVAIKCILKKTRTGKDFIQAQWSIPQ
jgi:hypothetical protein